jgi:hypothetical protein
MDYLAYIKDILKILGSILAISTAPENLAKGVVVTAILLILVVSWRILCEFRNWRQDQAVLAEEVKKVSTDTKFLVRKHCIIHKNDAFELMDYREKSDLPAS